MAEPSKYERNGRKGWRFQIYLGRGGDGKQIVRTRVWWPDTDHPDLKPHSSRAKELAYHEMRKFRLDLGMANTADVTALTVADLFDRWIDHKDIGGGRNSWSPTTVRNVTMWGNRAADFFGTAKLGNITPDRIDAFHADIRAKGASLNPDKRRPVSESTVARGHDALSAAFEYAKDNGWITETPFRKRHRLDRDTQQRQVPDAAAINAAIAHAETGPPMWAMFLRMLTVTAARRGEVLALRYSDLTGNQLTIRRNIVATKGATHVKAPKSGRQRIVMLSDDTVKRWHRWHTHVTEWLDELGTVMPEDGYLFTATPDLEKHLHPDSAKNWWARLKRDVPELDGITMHSLRHYGATVLANDPNLPITAAKEQLGHANLSTTQGYVHEDDVVKQQAGDRLAQDFS